MISVFLAALDTEEERIEYSRIYNELKEALIGYAFTITHNMSDAEDAVQEGFRAAIDHWAEISKRGETGIKRFLFVCVRNHALKTVRQKSRNVSLEWLEENGSVFPDDPVEDAFFDAIADEETVKDAKAFIDTLDKKTADVLWMYLEGFSIEDTAVLFSEKPDTIRKRLYRAKKRLREFLDAKGGDAR